MPIGVGVLGAGGINVATSAHLPAIKLVPELELKAICDVNAVGVKRFADQYGVDGYTDFEQLLERDDIQMIQVCTPDFLHAEHTVKAAKAGKHVLCQKPLAVSMEECQAIRAAAQESGVSVMTMQSDRGSDLYLGVKRALERGDIGEVLWVKHASKRRFFPYPEGSYHRKAEYNQFLHNGMHPVDMVCWLMGETPIEVCGMSSRHYPTDDRLEGDNYYLSQMRFASNAMALVEMNLMMIDPPGFPPRTSLEIVGSKGTLTLSLDTLPAFEVFTGGKIVRRPSVAVDNAPLAFARVMQGFARSILAGTPPPIPLDWSIAVLDTCLSTLESIERGEPRPVASRSEVAA